MSFAVIVRFRHSKKYILVDVDPNENVYSRVMSKFCFDKQLKHDKRKQRAKYDTECVVVFYRLDNTGTETRIDRPEHFYWRDMDQIILHCVPRYRS
jgi:hypothetical protein